jgi:hypothetical protein
MDFKLAGVSGIEPKLYGFEGRRAIQLTLYPYTTIDQIIARGFERIFLKLHYKLQPQFDLVNHLGVLF